MPVAERLPSPLGSLNDKELEVLRLLAAGHTVKSIAACLGRSEASINERLRDARRKTGVGSSRELARILDGQKIWDRNIDLSSASPADDTIEQPQSTGPSWSKGTKIMLLAMPLLAAGLMVTATNPSHQALPAQTNHATEHRPLPLVGSWSLNVDRIPADERPQRVTIVFRTLPDERWTTVVEMTGADGVTKRAESTAALDGVPVPVTGDMTFIDTVSLRRPSPNTLVMTLAKNGSPVSTRVYTVSQDQRSMTETIVWGGKTVPNSATTYFDRID